MNSNVHILHINTGETFKISNFRPKFVSFWIFERKSEISGKIFEQIRAWKVNRGERILRPSNVLRWILFDQLILLWLHIFLQFLGIFQPNDSCSRLKEILIELKWPQLVDFWSKMAIKCLFFSEGLQFRLLIADKLKSNLAVWIYWTPWSPLSDITAGDFLLCYLFYY